MISFNMPFDKLANANFDLLIDILAWQSAITSFLANQSQNPQEASAQLLALKNKSRQEIGEELFAKYGPDISEDLA